MQCVLDFVIDPIRHKTICENLSQLDEYKVESR